jgi:type I restriction enzyme S subunit
MMEKYSSYKDSGVKWLGDIPSHWELKHLRNFLTLFSEKGFGHSQLLSVTREKGVILRNKDDKEENHNFVPDDLNGYKHLYPGDFVINKMKSWQGSYGVSDYEGIVSPAYFTCKLRGVDPHFFSRAIRSKAYIGFFMQYSKGIRVDQWDLDPSSMKDIPFVLPPIDEQLRIVPYLDAATSKIDEAIAQQHQIISLLKERKKIVINHAVTKGLNPRVKQKETSIDWIGTIPEHWRLIQLRHTVTNHDNLRRPITADQRERTNPQYDYYGASGVIDKIDHYNVDDKVLLIAEDGANLVLRNLPLVYKAEGKFWVNNHAHILKPKRNDYDFMAMVLEAADYTLSITGSAQPKLSQANLNAVKLPIPPIEEQIAIVNAITPKVDKIELAINQQMEMVALLEERKQIIINNVVTGKVKVV